MARPLRIEYPGAVYHVTSRGNRRDGIYLDDPDRRSFLGLLAQALGRFRARCCAYCLMGNHYHLVLETPEGNLSGIMRQLNGVYTQEFNRKYGKCGHLFQGRYGAVLVKRDSHLLEACRYVVLNPVRAGLAAAPGEWAWSSFRAAAGLEKAAPWLSVDWLLGQFSGDARDAREKFIRFVEEGIGKSIWDGLRHGMVLGDELFEAECLSRSGPAWNNPEIPLTQRALGRPGLVEIIGGSKRAPSLWRRAVDEFGYSQKELADYLGLHYSYISRVLKAERSKVKT